METSGLNAVIRHVRRVVLVSSSDEELLVALACRRDEDAFEVLLKRHGPMVWAVCRRVLRHTQDAEDAFQATFLVLIRKSGSIRKRASVASWLYGVAYRCARKAQAINVRRRRFESLVAPCPQPVASEESADLDGAVNALPEKYRLPVVLCELQGRTRKEAANLLKIPEGTLSSRLATARKTLAKRLGARSGLLGIASAAPGKVPAPLLVSTIRTGLGFVAGGEAAGVVSGNAIVLSQGVLRAMLMIKLKTMVTGVVLLGTMGAGVSHYAHQALAIGPASATRQQVSSSKEQQGDEPRLSQSGDLLAHFQGLDEKQKLDRALSDELIQLKKKKEELDRLLMQKAEKYNSLRLDSLKLSRERNQTSVPDTVLKQAEADYRVAKEQWDSVARQLQLRDLGSPENKEVTLNLLKQMLADAEAQMRANEAELKKAELNWQRSKELHDLATKRLADLGASTQARSDSTSKNSCFNDLARRFPYRVPVQFHDRLEKKGARIEIQEVWGTSPKFQVGGQYVVHGRYEMPNHTKGKLYFYVTSEGNWPNSGPTLELQTLNVEKGSGEFTLMHSLGGPGQFHVQLDDQAGKDGTLANVYFK
jgi:RNA polymerase sigma factor (sigma-70 family)